MFPSRGITKKSMAVNSLNRTFNDSLESKSNGEQVYPSRIASVGPEEFNDKTDFRAFSTTEEEPGSSVYLGILPYRDFCLLQDTTSGKNRALGVERLQAAIEAAKSTSVLESNLTFLVEDACAAVSDSHIKVSIAGLQLLEPLIRRTGSSLTPHLPSLVEAMLGKMSTNKHVLKKTGMKMLVHLMHYSRPHDVTTEVAKFGLTHKHSKVREESLNVITAALIRFPKSEFRLIQLAREVMPALCDAKPRVRQACMECAVKIASLCNHRDFKQVMSFAIKNGHHSNDRHDMVILEALQSRIVRDRLPHLKEDGLVEHAMPVVGREIPLSEHGPDVDWIRDGALSKSGNIPNGLEGSSARRESSKLRPYRSASKKLPWEADLERTKDGDDTKNETTDLGATFTLAKVSPPRPHQQLPMSGLFAKEGSNSPPSHRPPTSKLFSKEGSNSPPSHRPPSGRKRLSDKGGELNGTISHSPNGNGNITTLLRDLRDMVPPSRGPLPPPIPPPGSKCARRHTSLPNGVVTRDLATRNGPRKMTNFGNGSPKLSPIGSATAFKEEEDIQQQQRQKQQSQLPPGDEFSETWPRSRAGLRGKGGTRKPTELITADPPKAVGGVHDEVRMSVLRPPSKPRVRNPITMKQRQEEKKLKTSLLQQQQPHQQLQDNPQDSPTLTEKEFLMCNNTTLQGADDEYYAMVPEDNTAPDNSLYSSLTSLCHLAPGAPELPKKAEIASLRKEMASRKAQLQTVKCSTSDSPPEFRRTPHDEVPVGPGAHRHQQERTITGDVHRRGKSGASIETDFNKSFTVGESLAHLHPSSTTWQAMQSLTQTAPPTAAAVPVSDKKSNKKKKKKRRLGSDEGEGSSGGSGPTLEERGNRADGDVRGHPQAERAVPPPSQEYNTRDRQGAKKSDVGSRLPAVKAGLRRAGMLGPEGQRPSIERGGTNTITMEIYGVKSPPPEQPSPEQLSPPVEVTRERKVAHGRRQRNSEPAYMFSDTRAMPGASKLPLPPHTPTAFTANEVLEDSCTGQLPEVVRRPYKKHSKYAMTRAKDEFQPPLQNGRWRAEGGCVVEDCSPSDSKSNLPELQPFVNPDRGLRECLDQLDISDWSEKCDGLTAVRRLAMFHPETLVAQLHTVTLAVVQEVKNLRSSVARAAIACLGDIFVYVGRYMDPDLERVVKVLLHKTVESNTFIREDVEKMMHEIVQYATPAKGLLAIIAGGQGHRSVQVRRVAAQFLAQSVEHYGPAQLMHTSRDLLERTLTATLNFITDTAAEPRYYGRKCLSHLLTAADFEKVASRTLNSQKWSKLKDAVETFKIKGMGEPPGEAVASRSRHPTGGPARASSHVRGTGGGRTAVEDIASKPRQPRRVSRVVHGGENPPLPDRLVERLNASDWEDRQEAIYALEQFVEQYPKALEPHMHKVFDAFNPRLTDRNSKVNLQALRAFSNMVPLLGSLMAPLSANVIKALMPNLASKNSTIRAAAVTVFDLISHCIEPMCLIQPITTHCQHGNARVQPIMINKLAELTEVIYRLNPKQVVRQVLPVMWHFLASKPPGSNDVREAIICLCVTLFNSMGQDFLDSAVNLPPQSQIRLNQILKAGNCK